MGIIIDTLKKSALLFKKNIDENSISEIRDVFPESKYDDMTVVIKRDNNPTTTEIKITSDKEEGE